MKKFLILLMCLSVFAFAGCGNGPKTDEASKENSDSTTKIVEQEENSEINPNATKKPVATTPQNSSEVATPTPKQKADVLSERVQENPVTNKNSVVELKFKNTNSDEYINSLNNKKVTMTGYISTLSPINGKFAYLMNMPYQSCPYCVPGTSEIYNTIAIYAKGNNKIEFTNDPVTVEGTLQTGTFTDEFGYEYGVKIADATVKKADVSKLSQNILIYSALTQDGTVDDIYGIINEIDMIVYYDYYQEYYQISPDQLTAFDTKRIDKTISKIKSVSETNYADIIGVLQNAKTVAVSANKNLEAKNYEANKELQPTLDTVFRSFSVWMSKYEL